MQMRGRPVCEQYQASGLLMWFLARRREQPARRAERLSCGTDEVLFPRTRIHYTLGLSFCLSVFFVGGGGGLFPQSLSAAPAYVQSNYATLHPTATAVRVQYTGAQTAGNLDVVIVGWSDSNAHVSSVKDSRGNAYHLAVGPTVLTSTFSQVLYYAQNLLAAPAGTHTG